VSAPGITAIVVSRGLDALLRTCLDHLRRALATFDGPTDVAAPDVTSARHRIVVVDDASPHPYRRDALGEPPPELLRLDVHRSFAHANNLAARLFPNELYLLLNNDVLLADDALARATALLARVPDAGICGSRLVFPDASIQHRGVVFGSGARGPYHLDRGRAGHLVPRASREWQAVTGACMLVRAIAWQQLGGLDETYPFGLEDVDLCLRARARGWRVVCCEDTDSLHFESMTDGRVALDVPSRKLFAARWEGRYAIDG
jgi:GT2 family glycosyltransferase